MKALLRLLKNNCLLALLMVILPREKEDFHAPDLTAKKGVGQGRHQKTRGSTLINTRMTLIGLLRITTRRVDMMNLETLYLIETVVNKGVRATVQEVESDLLLEIIPGAGRALVVENNTDVQSDQFMETQD